MKKSFIYSAAALTALGMSSMAHAAQRSGAESCAPQPPASCYPDNCTRCYCLGPDNYGVNAPVCPKTCNGDWNITLAGFYWNAHQDGMEYAIYNGVQYPSGVTVAPPAVPAQVLALNNLIDSHFVNPHFKWDFGFKLGFDYCTTCDGWDFGVLWTWYQGKAKNRNDGDTSDNQALINIDSSFSSTVGGPLYTTDIESFWKLELNLLDFEIGRHFWTSKYLSLRPFVGLRIAYLDQDWTVISRGGAFGPVPTGTVQDTLNDYNRKQNDFHGAGLRAGLDSTWNFGCGWALWGTMATSIVYGKFDVDMSESVRQAASPHTKSTVAQIHDNFRASTPMLDLALGVEWMGMFCECQYGIRLALAWENHLFFNQNQMWRANRIGDVSSATAPNNSGETVFIPRNGDLSTQGWTFTVEFSF